MLCEAVQGHRTLALHESLENAQIDAHFEQGNLERLHSVKLDAGSLWIASRETDPT